MKDEEGTVVRKGDRVQLVNYEGRATTDDYGTVLRFDRVMGTASVKWDGGSVFKVGELCDAPGSQLLVVSR